MTDFSGEIHPYLADLPVFDAEIDAIAESVAEVGLLHPITLDTEGRLIGGRHRLAACDRAGVEPTFEIYDGDPLAFILHDNATRKHQTTGQRAAENALALDSAGLRRDGRWDGARGRGLIRPDDGTNQKTWNNLLAQAGLVLDYVGRAALVAVAEGDRSMSDAYAAGGQARAELEREDRAREFIEAEDAELAAQVGSNFQSYAEAKAVWEERNREEAQQRREIEKGIKDALTHVSNALQYLDGGADDAQRFIEHNLPKHDDYLQGPRALTPQRLDAGIDFLTELRKARA